MSSTMPIGQSLDADQVNPMTMEACSKDTERQQDHAELLGSGLRISANHLDALCSDIA